MWLSLFYFASQRLNRCRISGWLGSPLFFLVGKRRFYKIKSSLSFSCPDSDSTNRDFDYLQIYLADRYLLPNPQRTVLILVLLRQAYLDER